MVLRSLPLWAALAAFGPALPAHAQIDQFIQGLIRPPPPPYYSPPPPAYPPPHYRDYPPAYYAPLRPRAPVRPDTTVADAQRMLGDLGYDAGPADGAAGPRLADALRGFQRDHGQRADGRLTGETLAALRAVWREHAGQGGKPMPAIAQAEAVPKAAAAQAATAGLPTEGKYCSFGPGNSYDMLLVRDAGEYLEFGFSSWTPTGSNFSVGGNAAPQRGAWVYESGMDSPDPTEHCRVMIRRSTDGSLSIATAENARCESLAGHNAGLIGPLVFPAASRMGNPPDSLSGEALMRVGCDKQRPARSPVPPPGLLFPVKAQAGEVTRPADLRLSCEGHGRPALFVTMRLFDPAKLPETLGLSDIEGPARSGMGRVKLEVARDEGSESAASSFNVNGAPSGDVTGIAVVAQPGTREEASLGRLAGMLTEGQGELTWELTVPHHQEKLDATLHVSAADASALSRSLRPCLAAR